MQTQPNSFEYVKYDNQDLWAYGFKLSNHYKRVVLNLPPTFGHIKDSKFIIGNKTRSAFDLHFATTKEEAIKEYNHLIAAYSEQLLERAQSLETYYISDTNSPKADYNTQLKLTDRFALESCNTEGPNTNKYGFTINLRDTKASGYTADLVNVNYNPETYELTIETWPDNPESDKHHIANISLPKN